MVPGKNKLNRACAARCLLWLTSAMLLVFLPVKSQSQSERVTKEGVDALLAGWKEQVLKKIDKDDQVKALANKYPLIVLHSRRFAGGAYWKAAFSFIHETNDDDRHGSNVQLLFDNGGAENTFEINMQVRQYNLVADLGHAEFSENPDPKKVDIDGPGQNTWLPGSCKAFEGHVYLERIRDSRGNNFYVLFKVIAVDRNSKYMAFLWRKLPGGKLVIPPEPRKIG